MHLTVIDSSINTEATFTLVLNTLIVTRIKIDRKDHIRNVINPLEISRVSADNPIIEFDEDTIDWVTLQFIMAVWRKAVDVLRESTDMTITVEELNDRVSKIPKSN